jgi:hypothetical protein
LFSVLAAVVPTPPLQSTSSLLAELPVHMPVTVAGASQQYSAQVPTSNGRFTVLIGSLEQSKY